MFYVLSFIVVVIGVLVKTSIRSRHARSFWLQ